MLQLAHFAWGARTHVVRARPLDASALRSLLTALSPPQFAFIRNNVFVPPAVGRLHAKLWARPAATCSPLQALLARLTRGERQHKLSYLFAFFHLSAGSFATARDGAWCSVASPRDARTLAQVARALAPGGRNVFSGAAGATRGAGRAAQARLRAAAPRAALVTVRP